MTSALWRPRSSMLMFQPALRGFDESCRNERRVFVCVQLWSGAAKARNRVSLDQSNIGLSTTLSIGLE
jgi:hypothetical protein